MAPNIHAKFHNQPFITRRAIWRYVFGQTQGSFRVRSTNFLLNLRDPPPISMKFGTLADNVLKNICANFQRCRSSGFRDMTFQKMEKGSIFATRPVSQMSITFFLLEVGSSMIALFEALIWLYNSYLTNYNKSQKPESYIFW